MFAEVIVDIDSSEVDRVFDYSFTPEQEIHAGDRVLVPFANRQIEGFVIRTKNASDYDASKIKQIIKKIDMFTAIIPEMLEMIDFMRGEFHLKIVDILRLFIPSELRNGKAKIQVKQYAVLNTNFTEQEMRATIRQNAKNMNALLDYMVFAKREDVTVLNNKFSSVSVKKFCEKNYLTIESEEKLRTPDSPIGALKNITHTKEQERAINAIELGKNQTYLLHGVTGSGKTEVYLSVIAKAISENKTAIMLVPEISLTPQVLASFKARFGKKVAILHSGLSMGERFDEWRRILLGDAPIVIGARSAVFAPLKNVGAIIIDEEHDQSYVSDSNPRYTTLDVASFRAKFNCCPLVLGSATPSITTYSKAENGDYKLLELPVRVNNKPLPKIQIVDMLSEIREGGDLMFSSALLEELEKCIAQNKQAMLFINRRGYSSFMMCKECGYVAKCSACDVSLVYHIAEEKLKCHYCGKTYKALTVCPECGSKYIKQGAVGTQKIALELSKLFPGVKILRMDNDTTQNKNAHQKILAEFGATKPSILVGTQMIAKGHDFASCTLVGILDADQSLYHSDYRSAERTFQLITQVSGRAGRSDDEGKVILQTYNPRHYVYKFASNYNYKAFYEKEINIMKTTNFPPYSKIIRLLFLGANEENVRQSVKSCYNILSELKNAYASDFIYFDVMKSPIARLQNKFRYQILMRIKLDNAPNICEKVYEAADKSRNAKVSVFVETNPQNLA